MSSSDLVGHSSDIEDEASADPSSDSLRLASRIFSKEIRCMLYGFGDDSNPFTETVDVLEELVLEFISEMTHRAMEIGRQGKVQVREHNSQVLTQGLTLKTTSI